MQRKASECVSVFTPIPITKYTEPVHLWRVKMLTYCLMMQTKAILLPVVCLLIISLSRVESDNFLPNIWDSIRDHKSYHMTYQIRMPNNSEVLALDEYASFNKQLFRLDLVSGENRVTYLTNGNTGEIFRYKAFTCETLSTKADDLGVIASLFKGYSIGEGGNRLPVYGIGPLWLRARESASSVSMIDQASGNKLDKHVGYLVKFDDTNDDVRYDLAFYFRSTKSFVSMIDWIDKTPEQTVEASAKLMALYYEELPDSDLEIPVGYGCIRAASFDDPINLNTNVRLFIEGYPSYASLDVLTSMPVDDSMTEWDNQATSVSIVRDSVNLQSNVYDYYTSHSRERELEAAKIKKIKKVWAAPSLNADQALVYTIDEQTGECQVRHVKAGGHMALKFPERPGLKQMSMSIDIIEKLFEDNTGFHFIREELGEPIKSISLGKFRTGFYEKRVDQFEVTANNEKVWSGPVSIVKKITSFILPQNLLLLSHLKVYTTVYFYNSDFSKIEYKAVFKLLDRGAPDVVQVLKDMDVGECFSDRQKQELLIKYPLNSNQISSRLESMAYLIEDNFYTELFRTSPIQPLQISKPEVSFNTFSMYLKVTLLDIPLWHTYDMKPNMKLIGSQDKSSFIDKFASNIDACSSSCDHYRCFRFSFEESSFRCRLELVKDALGTETCRGGQLYSSPEIRPNSSELRNIEFENRTQIRPQMVLDMFRELIEKNSENLNLSKPPSPLVIRVPRELIFDLVDQDVDDEYLDVEPISIESDMESLNEFIKSEDGKGLKSNLRVEYNVYKDEMRFVSTGQVERLTVSNYDDCASSCEDADCRSFSYCKSEGSCLLTKLHKEAEISKATYVGVGCTVFVLDYLSKFEDLGRVAKPMTARSIVGDVTERECAGMCMEADFSCQGFYHCEQPQKQSSCLMQDKHVSNTKDFAKILKASDGDSFCHFFSRSYLVQFDQYHGKKLQLNEKQVNNNVQLITDLGAEACAQSCIEGSCLAFDVCLSNQAESSHKLECHLALGELRESHLVSDQLCNTFVLSDKSQFKKLANMTPLVDAGQDSPDQTALDDQSDGRQVLVEPQQDELNIDLNMDVLKLFIDAKYNDLISGSHWFLRLFILFIGSILGATFVVVWRNKEDLIDRGLLAVGRSR